MAAEMIEDYDWESDESEDWESDEAFAESEDSAEDIGERARRRGRQRRYYRPGRGVQGMTVRGQDGRLRNLSFPTKLATAAETNRGLASQEVARRALTERLKRLEARAKGLQKNDSSVSGLVTLAIGGGLAGFGAFKAANGGFTLQKWASQDTTKMATLVSVTQVATSGAKLVINGRYHRSSVGMAADIYSVLQIGLFTFGSLKKPRFRPVTTPDIAGLAADAFDEGTLILDLKSSQMFEVIVDATSHKQFALA